MSPDAKHLLPPAASFFKKQKPAFFLLRRQQLYSLKRKPLTSQKKKSIRVSEEHPALCKQVQSPSCSLANTYDIHSLNPPKWSGATSSRKRSISGSTIPRPGRFILGSLPQLHQLGGSTPTHSASSITHTAVCVRVCIQYVCMQVCRCACVCVCVWGGLLLKEFLF